MELVFEIGTEELPASFQLPAVAHLGEQLAKELRAARLADDSLALKSYATPRRLALTATGLIARAPDVKKRLQGPPLKAAFGADGKPTQAAMGFAKKSGVPVEALIVDGERVVAEQEEKGQAVHEALPHLLSRLVAQLPFRKSMRWGDEPAAFARPVHWISAALDGAKVELQFADVQSGLTSRGHRFHAPAEFALPRADAYVDTLRAHRVLADWDERKRRVWSEVVRAASEAGPGAEPRLDAELLETVTGLVEEPHAVLGRFEAHFLELPPEVLVSEMRGHQKYFAVQDGATGKLLPAFVAVSNTKVHDPAVSRRGYERVLRARLSDGRFFFDEDQKVPLTARLERLERITFFAGLGTQRQRSLRLHKLATWLFAQQHPHRGNLEDLQQAADLCKTDLTCGMVSEFPELQGVMGRVYALRQGLEARVADALFEHWLPRGADDTLPERDEGALLGIADRVDQLVGFFGLGHEPSGTADPYGLRRAAIGLLRLVLGKGFSLDLKALLQQAQVLYAEQQAAGAPIRVSQRPELLETIWQFLLGRLESLWKGRAPDAISAILHTGVRDVVSLEQRLAALCDVRASQPEQFAAIAGAAKRINNILEQAQKKGLAPMAFHNELARHPAEQQLASALQQARERVHGAMASGAWAQAYGVLAELRPAVDGFFDDVMVMDPDPAQRDNRLALLRTLQELLAPLADFARLQS